MVSREDDPTRVHSGSVSALRNEVLPARDDVERSTGSMSLRSVTSRSWSCRAKRLHRSLRWVWQTMASQRCARMRPTTYPYDRVAESTCRGVPTRGLQQEGQWRRHSDLNRGAAVYLVAGHFDTTVTMGVTTSGLVPSVSCASCSDLRAQSPRYDRLRRDRPFGARVVTGGQS